MSEPSTLSHTLHLQKTSDRSLTYFLAEAITDLLTTANPTAPDTIAEVTEEIRRRNKQTHYWTRLIADHLRR